jgi:hypothetical protein
MKVTIYVEHGEAGLEKKMVKKLHAVDAHKGIYLREIIYLLM